MQKLKCNVGKILMNAKRMRNECETNVKRVLMNAKRM